MREISKDTLVVYYKWTSDHKDNIEKFKSKEIAIGDTDLG